MRYISLILSAALILSASGSLTTTAPQSKCAAGKDVLYSHDMSSLYRGLHAARYRGRTFWLAALQLTLYFDRHWQLLLRLRLENKSLPCMPLAFHRPPFLIQTEVGGPNRVASGRAASPGSSTILAGGTFRL